MMPVFESTYARLTAVYPGLRVHAGPPRAGDGWTRSADLVDGGSALEALIAVDAERGMRDHGVPLRPDVAASFCLHRYAWRVCLLMSLPWFLDRRVPHLPVQAVSVNGPAGHASADIRTFSCLPDDPAAGRPEARVAADEAALRHALRQAAAEHLGPVLNAFRPRLRRGPHALWSMATDALVEGLWHIGGLLDQERRAAADLTALLPGRTAPFTGGAAFRDEPQSCGAPQETGNRGELRGSGEGVPGPTRTRLSCCLYYTLPHGRTCATCPRRCPADDIEPLAAS
jgi:FhuF 2Fe-2S C-terminal domain